MGAIAKLAAMLMLCLPCLGQSHKALLIAPLPAAAAPDTDGVIYALTNLVAWWRAGDGCYSDAGTTPCTDGADVQQWNSKTNGYVAIQTTAGNKPHYRATTGPNSKPTVDFAGSSYWLDCATGTSWSQSNTIYTVSYYPGGGASGHLLDGTNATGRNNLYVGASPSWTYYQVWAGTADRYFSTVLWTSGVYEYQIWSINGANSTLYRSTTKDFITVTGGTPGSYPLDGVVIGARQDHAIKWSGKIAELILFNGGHSADNRMTVSNYLYQRYGL